MRLIVAKKAPKKAGKTKAAAKPAPKRTASRPAPPAKGTAKKKASPKPVSKPKSKPAAKRPAKPARRPAAAARGRSTPRAEREPALPRIAPESIDAADSAEDELDEEVPVVEPGLTPEEVEEFRVILAEKRRQIMGDMGSLTNEALNKNRRDASGDLSSMPIHMADLGSDNYEIEFTLGLIESERSVLREIDEALERIRKGTYGVCLGTGKPIGKARLRAKPWAKYCYEYTLAQETGRAPRY